MKKVLLAEFKKALDSLGIEAAYRVYTGNIYPYLTYEYYKTDITHEDGGTTGELLCEIWARRTDDNPNVLEVLEDIDEKLQDYFNQINIKVGNNVYHFDYASSTPDETGDANLEKIQVSIMTKYWKGA